jgi:hypothetical protein
MTEFGRRHSASRIARLIAVSEIACSRSEEAIRNSLLLLRKPVYPLQAPSRPDNP